MTIQDVEKEWNVPAIKRLLEFIYVSEISDEAVINFVSRNLLKELTDLEEKVMTLRCGLKSGVGMSLLEVSQELGTTRERVRQTEAYAVRKLRHPTRAKMIFGE